MKPLVAGLVTICLIAAAIVLGRGGSQSTSTSDTPEACLAAMFRAAQQGEVDAYRACFEGEALRRLEHDWTNQPQESITRSLAQSVATLKGFAIQDATGANADSAARDATSLAVERVFDHHNELQLYDMRRTSAGWKIIAVRSPEARTPAIAYGTPVFDASPADMKPSTSAEKQPR